MRRVFLIFILVFWGASAHAASYEQAKIALDQGQFDQAHSQATALSTNQGFTLAAEALNAKLLLGLTGNPSKTAKAAMALAQTVLEQEAENAEAQMQYAIAYGFYGRQSFAV